VRDVTTQRVLIHVPIIHTQADMGGLGEPIKRQLVQRFGQHWWQSKVSLIDRTWDEIEASLIIPEMPYDQVRIYQDGYRCAGASWTSLRSWRRRAAAIIGWR
jgi:hypothetical protein